MPFDNMISLSFTAAELQQIDDHLTGLEAIFAGKTVQLTATESQRYGRLGNETENWVNMVYADTRTTPGLVPDFVIDAEWTKDEITRDQLSNRAARLENLSTQVTDTNRLIGSDIYNTCLSVYNYTRYRTTQNSPGAKAFYEKWSVQFPGRGPGGKNKPGTP